jgi:hypothetical protein
MQALCQCVFLPIRLRRTARAGPMWLLETVKVTQIGRSAHCLAARSTRRRRVRTSPILLREHHPFYCARASPSSNDSHPRSRRLCQAGAKILVLVRRLWTGVVFDRLAAVSITPINADHRLHRIAQPVGPDYSASRSSSSEVRRRNIRVHAGAWAVTLSSAALVLVVIQPRRRAQTEFRMVNIEAASRRRGSSDLRASKMFRSARSERRSSIRNRCIRQLRVGPQQTAKVSAADAPFAGGVGDVDSVTAQTSTTTSGSR